jgi:hypothetical protein
LLGQSEAWHPILGDINIQHVPAIEIFGKGDILALCTNPKCPNKGANWALQAKLT